MELLWVLNPWWEDEEWYKKDKHLTEFSEQKIKWFPEWIKEISLKPFSLNFVIGPRQVGKTTGLKILIKEILQKLGSPFQILYLDLELFSDLSEFRESLLFYLNKIREKKQCFVILDEVSMLNGWYRIVKGLIDLGFFKNSVLVATGSSSINLVKHAESFIGRRGHGKDILVLPLSFPELVNVLNVNTKRGEKLQNAFKIYAERGGFPKSLNQHGFEIEFVKNLEKEAVNAGKSVEILKKIISTLFEMVPSALSFNAIGNRAGISSKTVESYIEFLRDLFLLEIAYLKEGKKVLFRREKKVFFRDPFVTRALALWTNSEIRKDFLYEFIVQEHMLRKFGEVYYYRNGFEIDCIANGLKVEVKAGKAHRRYPKNVTVLEEKDLPEFLLNL